MIKSRSAQIAKAVGWVTLLEILRDRILYNVILFAVLVFGMGFLIGRLSYVAPERVVLDFGLSAVSLSSAMVALLAGASLIAREFEKRTVYIAFSRPISRGQFVVGKFAGLMSVLTLNWVLLSVTYLLILAFAAPEFSKAVSVALFAGLFLALLQSFVVAGIAVLFSSFTTVSLSVIFTFGLYLVGNNISELRAFAEKMDSPESKWLLRSFAAVLPNLENFNVGMKATYGLPISWQFLFFGILYAALVVTVCLLLAGRFVRRREV